jgi:hypothetical protein
MALPSSGTISMSDIAEEKKGSGLPAGGYWQNISLRGLSVDSVTDFSFYNGDSLITADYPGTPDENAPHGMAEFYGYSQFSWGSPSTPTSNVASIFNMDTDSLNSGDVTAATTVNIRNLVANKRIDFYFINTLGGGPGTSPITTDQESVTYTGTLSNLEARFVFNTMDLYRDTGAGVGGEAEIRQAFDTSGQIDTGDISADGTSVTGATTVDSLNSNAGNNVTFNSPWGNIGTDNNIDKSAMLYVHTEGIGDTNGTAASVRSGSAGTIAVQLRANQDNNSIVTLYTRSAGSWGLQVYSYEDDTT